MVQRAGEAMLTVLHVAESTEGGVRRHLRELVSALDPQAFRSVLAVSCGRDPAFGACDVPAYRARGVEVFEVPMRRSISPVSDAWAWLSLVRVIRRVRPDVVHAHSSKAGVLARAAGALCGVPVVYTPHGFAFLMGGGERSRRFYRFIERSARSATAALIAVSQEEVREALALGYARERVFLIANGIPPCACKDFPAHKKESPVVGFFGRLTRQKGPDVLLEAVPEIVSRLPHVRFRFYGDGEMGAALRNAVDGQRAVQSCVSFLGAYPQDAAAARMRETDVLAVPSRWEGCPYVVLEAFASGVPVVASAVGGIPDLVRNGVNGLLVAPDDSEALCDGLLRLLRDAPLRRSFAEQGRETLRAYTAERMASAIGDVYCRVARAH